MDISRLRKDTDVVLISEGTHGLCDHTESFWEEKAVSVYVKAKQL